MEALAVAPLSTYECYVGQQTGKLPSNSVVLYDGGGRENAVGISAGTGTFEEVLEIVLEARLDYAETAANLAVAYSVLTQLKAFVRSNRRISAGGDVARYATFRWEGPSVESQSGAEDASAKLQRVVRVYGTWTAPGA